MYICVCMSLVVSYLMVHTFIRIISYQLLITQYKKK
uniref:Uncharacterized protein n=1 Tax=Anguilla anguilla TaxID=7936 RepID=A0A0E9TBM0_ANGAN